MAPVIESVLICKVYKHHFVSNNIPETMGDKELIRLIKECLSDEKILEATIELKFKKPETTEYKEYVDPAVVAIPLHE